VPQQSVPNGVAAGLVDQLEAVEIDQDECDLLAVALGARGVLDQLVLEAPPVSRPVRPS
jgi:hypothetical protein